MAKDKPTPTDQGRTFRVTQAAQQVGPWVHPAAFTEHAFAAQHPIPDTAAAKTTIDAETYHADLLYRLQTLGLIAEDPNATPSPLPGQAGGPPSGNQSIRDSVTTHAQSSAIRNAAGQEDQKARALSGAPVALPSPPPERNAAVTQQPVVTQQPAVVAEPAKK